MAAAQWPKELDRLYAVFEATSDGIALFDLEGRLLLANLAFRKFFGLIPEGLSHADPARTLDFLKSRARDAGEFERRFRRLLLQRETTEHDTVELALPHPRTLHRVCAPARDEAGKVVGHVHTLRDVTREREVAQMKSEFVSRVSHELRTPLTSIKGSLQLLMESARALPASDQELLGVCLRNTDRLIGLVNDILDLSRIEAGRLKLRLADQTVPPLVEAAMAGVRVLAAERGVNIEARLPPDLPPVCADRDRIVQVLTKLLHNAVRFSDPGGLVEVAARAAAGTGSEVPGTPDRGVDLASRAPHNREFIEVTVSDQGQGIAAEHLDEIFGSFHQLDEAAARDSRGTGLGLAICKGIIEGHGGRIWADSKGLGHGTTVTLMLPQMGPPRRRILVAEDDQKFARLLLTMLEAGEFVVTVVTDGRATLDSVRQSMPDLLILDLLLPDLDGWEVLKALRGSASTRDLPILALTALGAADAERTLALGADEYLSKPISPTVLIATINRLLAEAERRQRATATDRVAARATPGDPPPADRAEDRPPRVLVVEDDRITLELMGELLSSLGLEVRTCGDGREVMPLAKAIRPDLILLDINLPNLDGLTVARMLREDPETRSVRIVAVSAYAVEGEEERILKAGCDGFIPKPLQISTFFATVSTFLNRDWPAAPAALEPAGRGGDGEGRGRAEPGRTRE
jgi:PAS domain S-box-containing protein